jgi:hypothetical protein
MEQSGRNWWQPVANGRKRTPLKQAKTVALGCAVRLAQRILALTLGMLLNRLSGRPARALAAYDGR